MSNLDKSCAYELVKKLKRDGVKIVAFDFDRTLTKNDLTSQYSRKFNFMIPVEIYMWTEEQGPEWVADQSACGDLIRHLYDACISEGLTMTVVSYTYRIFVKQFMTMLGCPDVSIITPMNCGYNDGVDMGDLKKNMIYVLAKLEQVELTEICLIDDTKENLLIHPGPTIHINSNCGIVSDIFNKWIEC